jgi:hypothetical protein
VRVAAIVAEAHATPIDSMAQEGVILLTTIHGETNKAALRVSALECKLMVMRWAQDAPKEKIPNLAAKAATTERQRVVMEEQCEHLVHECGRTTSKMRGPSWIQIE